MNKLTSAEAILEAAYILEFEHSADNHLDMDYMQLAERLAYCVRVTELVEEGGTDFDTYSGMILRQAAQKGQIDEGVP